MTRTPDDMDMLEDVFAAARRAPPEPGADLLARIEADALRLQAGAAGPSPRRLTALAGWRAALAEAVGGWPALTGLAAAALAGVWIGISAPAGLAGLAGMAQAMLGTPDAAYLIDLDPAVTFEIAEGGG